MYCIIYDDDTEKIAKGVNISIEFNEYKDVSFDEKVIWHKMKIIKVKNMKLVLMISTKYHYHFLTIKDTL